MRNTVGSINRSPTSASSLRYCSRVRSVPPARRACSSRLGQCHGRASRPLIAPASGVRRSTVGRMWHGSCAIPRISRHRSSLQSCRMLFSKYASAPAGTPSRSCRLSSDSARQRRLWQDSRARHRLRARCRTAHLSFGVDSRTARSIPRIRRRRRRCAGLRRSRFLQRLRQQPAR